MRLNLGCGDHRLKDWTNVDVNPKRQPDECFDLAVFPWPLAGECAERIYAGHVLEHFDKHDGVRFLCECRRLIIPGGCLRVAVPDMDIFIPCLVGGDWSPVNGYEWRDANALFGGGDREPDPRQRHRYLYSAASLMAALDMADFEYVSRMEFDPEIDNRAYASISLYMEAR